MPMMMSQAGMPGTGTEVAPEAAAPLPDTLVWTLPLTSLYRDVQDRPKNTVDTIRAQFRPVRFFQAIQSHRLTMMTARITTPAMTPAPMSLVRVAASGRLDAGFCASRSRTNTGATEPRIHTPSSTADKTEKAAPAYISQMARFSVAGTAEASGGTYGCP